MPAPGGWKFSGLRVWFCLLRFRQKLAWTSTEWKTQHSEHFQEFLSGTYSSQWPHDSGHCLLPLNVQFFPTSPLATSLSILPSSLCDGRYVICNTTPFLWFLKNATHPRQNMSRRHLQKILGLGRHEENFTLWYQPQLCLPVFLPIKNLLLLAISLLGIYLEKILTWEKKNTLTPMFIAALFTIGKTWKQLKCPSTETG